MAVVIRNVLILMGATTVNVLMVISWMLILHSASVSKRALQYTEVLRLALLMSFNICT